MGNPVSFGGTNGTDLKIQRVFAILIHSPVRSPNLSCLALAGGSIAGFFQDFLKIAKKMWDLSVFPLEK
jgi:hypothetical protein